MTVQDLKTTLTSMNANGMYKEMIFYLEACESGSMFESWAAELEQLNSRLIKNNYFLNEE